MEESEISDALKKKQHSNKLATVRGMNFGGKPYAYSIRHTRDRHLLQIWTDDFIYQWYNWLRWILSYNKDRKKKPKKMRWL